MNSVKVKALCFTLILLTLVGCDRRVSDSDSRIALAVAETTCDSARKNVLMLLKVASVEENIDSVATLAEQGKLTDIRASHLEGEVARKLFKYHSSWAKPPKNKYLSDVGSTVSDYSEQDELAWKIGKEICIKLAQQ